MVALLYILGYVLIGMASASFAGWIDALPEPEPNDIADTLAGAMGTVLFWPIILPALVAVHAARAGQSRRLRIQAEHTQMRKLLREAGVDFDG